jgi:acetyl-CoA acyltransferase 1
MGVGPAVAIPAAVKSAGLEIEDIDLFELNEVCLFFMTHTFSVIYQQ